jgi:hypothetical protein
MVLALQMQEEVKQRDRAAVDARGKATMAKETATRTAREADEAEEAARAAARVATGLRGAAEHAAKDSSMTTRAAEIAGQVAAVARRRSQEIEEALNRATLANTKEAWSEVILLASPDGES